MNEFLRKILYLPEQQSTVARDVDGLHYFVILVTMAGATAVAVVTAYFLIKYRRSTGRGEQRLPEAEPVQVSRGKYLVIEGAVVAGLLGLFLLWWVLGFRQYVRMQRPPQDSMEIYVTAKKWMWGFAYPDGGGSMGVLYVPVGRPIKLVMTSRDVIHSFYVPAFRIKQDVVPGRVTTAWFEVVSPGTYDIYCAEYCGAGHSTMRATVVALEEAQYRQRLESPESRDMAAYVAEELDMADSRLSMAELGERVANRHGCLRCHTVDGTPHIGPTWARMYGSTVILDSGATVVVDEAYITESMMDPLARMHRGFQPVMPSYRGLITAAETGAIVEYIKSLRSVPITQAQDPLPQGAAGTVTIPIPAQPRQDSEPGGRSGPPDAMDTPLDMPLDTPLDMRRDTIDELLDPGERGRTDEEAAR
jgi:cytochrome c oxidase subunit II